jgi:transcriptional regulator with XRE-family HTH domain
MPWFPIKGVVRRLRLERHWERKDLAKKSGIKQRTIRLWESDNIPRKGQDDTVRGFAAAFQVPPETLADWLDYDPSVVDDLNEEGSSAPSKSTLGIRAARDDLRESITLPDGERVELIRPRLLNRLKTASGLGAGRYAITGRVKDHRDMPPIVGVRLGVDPKLCGQFYFLRKLNNGDLCYASPFTANGEHTTRLLDAADARELVTIVVRVEIREPDGKEFKGFVFFQKKGEKPKMWRWCFVVEQVLEGEIPVHYGEPIPAVEKIQIAARPTVRPRLPRSRAPRPDRAVE